jgi:hypothetical protein
MRKFLTISLAIAIMAVFQMPLWCALVDTFAWFLTGHAVTGIPWSDAQSGRVFFAIVWTGITIMPTMFTSICIMDSLE